MGRVRVLYVAGSAYSGSTLLGRLVGEADGAFAGGELRSVWSRGFARDHLCGCGEPFSLCPVWSAVVAEAFGGRAGVDVERLVGLEARLLATRRLPHLAIGRGAGGDLRFYRDHVARLYRAIARVTDARFIIDTSKAPTYGLVLDTIPELDVRVVHLVRDARAVLYSRERRPAPATGGVLSLALYDVWHAATELLWGPRGAGRYLRVRYEDFADDPERVTRDVAAFAGLDGASPRFDGRRVELPVAHTIDGNRSRFASGPTEIVRDEEWKAALPPSSRWLALGLAWPLLVRHGYLGRRRPGEGHEHTLGLVDHPR